MGFHMLQLVCVPIYTIRWRRRFLSWGERQEEANCKFSTNGGLIFYSSIQPAIHLFELSCLFLFYFFSHLSSYQEPVWQHVALQVKHVFQIYIKKKKHKRIKIFFYAKYRLITYIAGVLRTEPKLHSKQMWIHIEKCKNECNQENNRLIS